ncbi:hypothetical protein LA04_16855 [Enterobacter sp. UCD-UG_FMILLET]|uniref:O-antigen polymerase n=1 Tax=Enterobacter sp. UCD-UG_FMILLET TaxID=1542468 RepID=UPI000513C3F6|nr:O-antigen polymerase [Enterobacter sp. UCD-UG_FMILLET]KGI62606.1 hypothetical protein LA04_16855 [Enterobacter sp. UCD-UG_FMILLET]
MAINVMLLLFFAIITLFANFQLRIFSFRPTVLGALFLLALFIEIVPGTILVAFFNYPMSFGVDTLITDESKIETFRYTFLSISILLLMVSLSSCICRFDVDITKLNTTHLRVKLITFFSFVVILIKIFSVGDIPFLMAMRGDFDGAALAKAQILRNEVGFGGLFIGYIFVYFPYISLVYSYCHKKKYLYSRLLFRINLLLIIIYSMYDMQKSKLIVVLFILFILYLKSTKRINYIIITVIPAISLILLCSFFILLHNIPLGEVFDSVLARLFIGQTEGSFMIYQALTPDISRIAYGMPLGGLFGVYAVDPAAEIITIFFPTAGDAWVNSNSYFQAHAWSIFGDVSLILGPLFVALNIIGLYFLKEFFSRIDRTYASCVYIVSILTLPIVNDFSYFLFFKSWFCMIVLMIFYLATINIIESFLKLKKTNI